MLGKGGLTMEMRDRLIELINDCRSMDGYGIDLVEKQADHLLANGVIVPPCKVGDKIYMLVTRKTHSFKFEKGKRMLRVDNQHTFIKQTYLTRLNFFKVLDDFGKTVFLTKEEAEKALKEREGNG